jgi:hypothetical protein
MFILPYQGVEEVGWKNACEILVGKPENKAPLET